MLLEKDAYQSGPKDRSCEYKLHLKISGKTVLSNVPMNEGGTHSTADVIA